MNVVGSVFCVLGASLVNLYPSRDARAVDRVGVDGEKALWFTALTKF